MVARTWDDPSVPSESEPGQGTRHAAPRDSDRPQSIVREELTPFVVLPKRTTHGGDWGPVLREKLTRIALEGR